MNNNESRFRPVHFYIGGVGKEKEGRGLGKSLN